MVEVMLFRHHPPLPSGSQWQWPGVKGEEPLDRIQLSVRGQKPVHVADGPRPSIGIEGGGLLGLVELGQRLFAAGMC